MTAAHPPATAGGTDLFQQEILTFEAKQVQVRLTPLINGSYQAAVTIDLESTASLKGPTYFMLCFFPFLDRFTRSAWSKDSAAA